MLDLEPLNQNVLDSTQREIIDEVKRGSQRIESQLGWPEPKDLRIGLASSPSSVRDEMTLAEARIFSDVLAARDSSQFVAAERLRISAGRSAVEELLGLDRQPPVVGFVAPPPGMDRLLSRLSSAQRRAILRSLLLRERERIQYWLQFLPPTDGDAAEEKDSDSADELWESTTVGEKGSKLQQIHDKLSKARRMLDLVEGLLSMHDYTLSQMAAFCEG